MMGLEYGREASRILHPASCFVYLLVRQRLLNSYVSALADETDMQHVTKDEESCEQR